MTQRRIPAPSGGIRRDIMLSEGPNYNIRYPVGFSANAATPALTAPSNLLTQPAQSLNPMYEFKNFKYESRQSITGTGRYQFSISMPSQYWADFIHMFGFGSVSVYLTRWGTPNNILTGAWRGQNYYASQGWYWDVAQYGVTFYASFEVDYYGAVYNAGIAPALPRTIVTPNLYPVAPPNITDYKVIPDF